MKKTSLLSLFTIFLGGVISHAEKPQPFSSLVASEAMYGKIDQRKVKIFTLSNAQGIKAQISEYGANLVSLYLPDRDGKSEDVTLGYDTLKGWRSNTSYFGATVGRYGNRIAHGQFSLNGKKYKLATNNSPGGIPCSLHGGLVGFDKVVWDGKLVRQPGKVGVELRYTSKDGEEGFPGTLKTKVTYWLTDTNELIWEATATTDKATPVNLVQHTYWNLTGNPQQTINHHFLQLEADHYLPTDKGLIPTGKIASVAGTPMDFTKATAIGKRVNQDFEALKFGGGYDHCWVLRKKGSKLKLAATLYDPSSGRVVKISTDQPGIQFYGDNFLDGKVKGKKGIAYPYRSGLCLETQKFPDSPNQKSFPNCILRKGETYHHKMVFHFSVNKTLLKKGQKASQKTSSKKQGSYLFSFFKDNGQDGLHLASSQDGLHWKALKNDQPFLKPEIGGKLMRDPCIIQGPDKVFHMVWTTSWNDKGIGIAHSKDLIHWSKQKFLPVMKHEPKAKNCWAPEITWDSDGKQYVIYWATTISGQFKETEKNADKGWNHRIYFTTTKDFKTYTPTKLFYEPGFNVIDSTIVKDGDHYVMVLKNETLKPPAKDLYIAMSKKITGPWKLNPVSFTPKWVEGPTCLKVGDEWIVYYDEYSRGKYGARRTKDFKHWEDVSKLLKFPKGIRHGTAFFVSKDILENL